MAECEDCGHPLEQQSEKAIATGEWKIVWSDGATWVCPVTGNEHSPV